MKKNLGFYAEWIAFGLSNDWDIFILTYEDLVNDFEETVRHLASFFGVKLSPEDLACIMDNQQGAYHRKHSRKTDKIFSGVVEDNQSIIDNQDDILLKSALDKCMEMKKCQLSGHHLTSHLETIKTNSP